VLHSLDHELTAISAETTATKWHREEHERAMAATLVDILERQKDKSGLSMLMKRGYLSNSSLGSGGDKDGMDVDDPVDNSKGKNRKCVTLRDFCAYTNLVTQSFPGDSSKATEKTQSILNI
jgi:hypothetical protein